MKPRTTSSWLWKPTVFAALLMGIVSLAEANTPEVEIHNGRIWNTAGYDGGDGWSCFIMYPAVLPDYGEREHHITRAFHAWSRKAGTYFMSTDFTDVEQTVWPNVVSYFFRSGVQSYNYPPTYVSGHFDYVWPLGQIRDLRWDRPRVIINDTLEINFQGRDGNATPNTAYPSYGPDPRPHTTVVADQVTEELYTVSLRYVQGVKVWKKVYSYAHGSAHQDYVLYDIILKNDGVNGDYPGVLTGTGRRSPDTTQTPTQTVNNAVWWQLVDIQDMGSQIIPGQVGLYAKDIEGMYIQPWPGVDNTACMTWDIDSPVDDGPDYGDPGGDTFEHHMVANAFIGLGPLFVSTGPGTDYATNLPGQPLFRIIGKEKLVDLTVGAADSYAAADMDAQREIMTNGGLDLPIDQSYRTWDATADVKDHVRGPTVAQGFGPAGGDINVDNYDLHGWDIPPGDSVRIVLVLGAGGIDIEEGRRIGQQYAVQKAANPTAPDTWMSQADIELYMTGKDTALKALNLAYWNFYGQFAPGVTAGDLAKWGIPTYATSKPGDQNQPFNAPDPPRPPGMLKVNARDAGGIIVKWTRESESAIDFDKAVADFAGYRVYRQAGSRMAPLEVVKQGPASNFTVDGEYLTYVDAGATPGVEYWYSVTAYDDGTQNWAEAGVPLECSRWWVWTGNLPGTGVTPKSVGIQARPGAYELAIRYNAPNPFNPSTVVTYSLDRNYRDVSLRVYDVLGREVKTLVDGQSLAAGIHQVTWNGTDNTGRQVGSGVYVARLTTPNGTRASRMLLVK